MVWRRLSLYGDWPPPERGDGVGVWHTPSYVSSNPKDPKPRYHTQPQAIGVLGPRTRNRWQQGEGKMVGGNGTPKDSQSPHTAVWIHGTPHKRKVQREREGKKKKQ